MATYYPGHDNQQLLLDRIAELEKRNKKLNIDLMRKSAEASEAREKTIRWEAELKIVADQTGHNLCWVSIARLLKNTIGYLGKYPDPDNVTKEEFKWGCDVYIEDIFGPNKGK